MGAAQPKEQSDDLRPHPAAEVFPLMHGAEFDALISDIRDNGQREPIILHEGKILDGRNRYRACLSIPRVPEFMDWTPVGTPEAFVVSMNLHRRHLNETQRAMIAARLVTTPAKGFNKFQKATRDVATEISVPMAAKLLNVEKSTVSSARRVIRDATKEEIAEADSGKLAVGTLAKQIRSGIPAEERPRQRVQVQLTGKKKRAHTVGVNMQIWSQLREGLTSFAALPNPADVAAIARGYDRNGLVEKRLTKTIQWLKEFEDAWSNCDEAGDN